MKESVTPFPEVGSILSHTQYGLEPAVIERGSSNGSGCLSETSKIFLPSTRAVHCQKPSMGLNHNVGSAWVKGG